jgi:hypothetical protein
VTSNDVNLITSDLRTDADWWDDISETMSKALKTMQDYCGLPYATFDGISHGLGATRNYEATYQQMVALVSGGVVETASIATRLRATANNMIATDQAAADMQGP